MKRRDLFLALAGLALVASGLTFALRSEAAPQVRVFRSPTCGCCVGWARHLERGGFDVEVVDVDDLEHRKEALGVPRGLGSCHTAEVEGFVVEGHVPAEDVWRLVRERPDVRGLAVPGMPEGSPGMEGPNPERYTVFAFGERGVRAFSEHGP